VIRSSEFLFLSLSISIAIPHIVSGKIQVEFQHEKDQKEEFFLLTVFQSIKYKNEVKANFPLTRKF